MNHRDEADGEFADPRAKAGAAGTPTGVRYGDAKFLYEPYHSAHARVELLEAVNEERWAAQAQKMDQLTAAVERIERRVWMIVSAVSVALIGQMLSFGLRAHFLN